MNWPASFGWALFIAVPLALWGLGALANRGHGFWACVLAFMVGSDNRLSLSRLQAFVWTLVIFGSFAAAMSIHTPIKSATPEEVKAANDAAKKSSDDSASRQKDYEAAKADEAKAIAASQAAHDAATVAEAEAQGRNKEAKTHPETEEAAKDAQVAELNAARKRAADARVDEQGRAALLPEKSQAVAAAKASWEAADAEDKRAQELIKSFAWVQIPPALLALAGIAIGSGVFSSLIASVNGDSKTANITDLKADKWSSLSVPPGETADVPKNPNADCLVIAGSDMGDSGKVLLGGLTLRRRAARVIYWKHDGTGIAVELPNLKAYTTLVVETSNGKLGYELGNNPPNFKLGAPRIQYDFADLFRDDQNPESMSLMKFQMFGWTVIAISIYVYLLLNGNLTPQIQSLPQIDPSVAMLTGVSQAGYLTGKAVSKGGSNQS